MFYPYYYNSKLGLGTYAEVQVEPTKVSDLQSIVLYNNNFSIYQQGRVTGISVQLIREKNLSVFDNVTFNKVKLKRTRSSISPSHPTTFRIQEFQIWMYDGVDISNIAAASNGVVTVTAPTHCSSYLTEYINNNTFYNQATINQGYYAGSVIGDEVVFSFNSSQNLSQLASIIYYPMTENYHGIEPTGDNSWRYSAVGCSIQIYNDDNELFSYELKSQKFAFRVDGPAIDSVPSNMFTPPGDKQWNNILAKCIKNT